MTAILSELLAASPKSTWGSVPSEKAAEHARLKDQYNQEALDRWEDPAWQREQALLIASEVDYGFTYNNLFQTYFPVRNVGMFEKVTLRERRGLQVFYTHRGGYIEETQLQVEDFEVPRDTLGFHISEFEDKLQANFADSIESLVALGGQRMEAEVNRRIFTMLQEAVPSSSPYYEDASSTGLTPEVLNQAITDVYDAIKPNGVTNVPVTIVGRAAAIDQISDFPGFGDEALEEIRLRGRLGTYRAANIVRLTNYTDENGVSYMPDDEVWVFGGNVGLFVMYGPAKTRRWVENTVDYVHYRTRKDIGGLIHHPEQARRIQVA